MSVVPRILLLTLALCLSLGQVLARAGRFSAVYDLEGNRTRKTAGGVTTHFLVATVNPTGWHRHLPAAHDSLEVENRP